MIQTQRGATMRHLQELTRLKLALTAPVDAPPASIGVDPELLVLEHRLFAVEAQLRWLDHAEASLAAQSVSPVVQPAHTVPTGGTP